MIVKVISKCACYVANHLKKFVCSDAEFKLRLLVDTRLCPFADAKVYSLLCKSPRFNTPGNRTVCYDRKDNITAPLGQLRMPGSRTVIVGKDILAFHALGQTLAKFPYELGHKLKKLQRSALVAGFLKSSREPFPKIPLPSSARQEALPR